MTNKSRYDGKKQLGVFVDVELFAELKKLSTEKGMFFSRYVEQILKEYVERNKNNDR